MCIKLCAWLFRLCTAQLRRNSAPGDALHSHSCGSCWCSHMMVAMGKKLKLTWNRMRSENPASSHTHSQLVLILGALGSLPQTQHQLPFRWYISTSTPVHLLKQLGTWPSPLGSYGLWFGPVQKKKNHWVEIPERDIFNDQSQAKGEWTVSGEKGYLVTGKSQAQAGQWPVAGEDQVPYISNHENGSGHY